MVRCIPPAGKVYPEGYRTGDADIAELLVDVGDTLQHIRVAQRIQMADLAEMGNMSPSMLSRIERGVGIDRGVRRLYVITGLLGVRLSEVLRFSEQCTMSEKGSWPSDGSNSPIVDAILSTAPGYAAPTDVDQIQATQRWHPVNRAGWHRAERARSPNTRADATEGKWLAMMTR